MQLDHFVSYSRSVMRMIINIHNNTALESLFILAVEYIVEPIVRFICKKQNDQTKSGLIHASILAMNTNKDKMFQ